MIFSNSEPWIYLGELEAKVVRTKQTLSQVTLSQTSQVLHTCALTLPSQNQGNLKKHNFQNIIFGSTTLSSFILLFPRHFNFPLFLFLFFLFVNLFLSVFI